MSESIHGLGSPEPPAPPLTSKETEDLAPNNKKKGLPLWLVIAVIAICLVVVFFVYNSMTATKPNYLKTKKNGNQPPAD